MAILPKLVGLSYKEISLQSIAPDSVYTAFWPAAHYLIKETLPETLACVTRWIIALIGTNGYLLIWCEKVRKKKYRGNWWKKKMKERSNKCQKPAQKLITAQRHSKACAEKLFPVLHSAIITQFAQKVYIIVVRERWRSGYLWVLSLFGTTFLRSVFSWVTLSRSYELRRSSRLLENEKGGEVIEKSSQCEHKALNYGELLQVDKSWSNCNKCWRLVLWCIKTFLMSSADFEGRS